MLTFELNFHAWQITHLFEATWAQLRTYQPVRIQPTPQVVKECSEITYYSETSLSVSAKDSLQNHFTTHLPAHLSFHLNIR